MSSAVRFMLDSDNYPLRKDICTLLVIHFQLESLVDLDHKANLDVSINEQDFFSSMLEM